MKDLAGNHWYIATHQGGGHVPPGLGSVTPFLHPRGAPGLIEFLKQAFAAEEMATHRGPDGAILHAKIRVGGSVIEMGEAHGEWGPMPKLWDTASGRLMFTLSGHQASVTGATFNRDGKLLATASEDRTARLWDTASGGVVLTLTGPW